MNDNMGNAVGLSHLFLRERIKPGDRVMDATCGNGHDTLFLAGLVGAGGTVFAFDVQEQALEKTRQLLGENGYLDRVQLFHAGHEELAAYVADPVQAVVFNLGYLPGSDKSCITRAATTLAALEQASRLVVSGGVIIVVVYPGHDGGEEEAAAVKDWARALPRSFSAWCNRQVNRSSVAPYVILVAKVS